MNISEVLSIQLDNVGQRLFSEVCAAYYKQPINALKFSYNITHGEFSCQIDNSNIALCIMYLASNTSDRRWAIQYIDTVAYGPNPGATHLALVELLKERALSKVAEINGVAFSNGQGQWTDYLFPSHVRDNQRIYDNC